MFNHAQTIGRQAILTGGHHKVNIAAQLYPVEVVTNDDVPVNDSRENGTHDLASVVGKANRSCNSLESASLPKLNCQYQLKDLGMKAVNHHGSFTPACSQFVVETAGDHARRQVPQRPEAMNRQLLPKCRAPDHS